MENWHKTLRIDPLPALQASDDPALLRHVEGDLLGRAKSSWRRLWDLPEVSRILRKQQPDGRWRYPKQPPPPTGNYDLLETFRQLRFLVQLFHMDREHDSMSAAAEWIFSCQTEEGDIRGILGTQYTPYYDGMILALLIEAGYANDPRTNACLDWLLRMRQDDGGWIVPAQGLPSSRKTVKFWHAAPLPPDRSMPHAHMATGMALRAMAVHPRYRRRGEAKVAGARLKERFFKADKYNDRKAASYWTKLGYPYWWTDLLMALDTVSLLGFGVEDEHVASAVQWFLENQEGDGLWPTGYGHGPRVEGSRLWVGYRACLVLKRLLG
jgi:GNAT superfamily N-acetyltransferase